jgi:GNAT superfamily N-acetyltransferase
VDVQRRPRDEVEPSSLAAQTRRLPADRGSSVEIRRIRTSDKDPFRELRLRSLTLDPMAFGSTLEAATLAGDSVWSEWVQRASSTDDAISLLAVESGGRLVGHVGSTWEDEVTWLGSMWIEPEYRGRGLGAGLLDAVLKWADTVHPRSEVRLSVVPTQEIAIRLYLSRGFVATGKVSPLTHTPGAVYHEMARRRSVPKS